jgi:hypothetical protein
MPFWLEIAEEQGTAFDIVTDDWASYLSLLEGWRWFVTGKTVPTFNDAASYLGSMAHGADDIVSSSWPQGRRRGSVRRSRSA